MKKSFFLPAFIFNILILLACYFGKIKLAEWNMEVKILLWGNILLFAICFASFELCVRGLHSKNNHAFFRMVYGSFMLKLLLIAGAALVYILLEKKNVNIPALISCMVFYLIYTGLEVAALMKDNKQKRNN